MSEIKTLIFLFACVSVPIFVTLRFVSGTVLRADVKKWTVIWGLMTISAFLSYNFWIFLALLTVILLKFTRNDPILKICSFFILLPSLPTASITVPGFGLVNFLFNIDLPLLLAMVLLFPLAISSVKPMAKNALIRNVILALLILAAILTWRESSSLHRGVSVFAEISLTSTIRIMFYKIFIIFIPFLAMRKFIRTSEDLNRVFFAIVFSILLQAAIGMLETIKYWHLYNEAIQALGLHNNLMSSLSRENLLRASAALGHPITFGYVVMIGIGFFLNFYSLNIKKKKLFYFLLALLVLGLLSTLSRGPWVGAFVGSVCFVLLGKKAFKKINMFGVTIILLFSILSLSPVGERFISLLPYMDNKEGDNASATIDYREKLMEQSIKVIKKNPYFGSGNYKMTPEMEVMRQGEGIIDIVNSYLYIALDQGLVGLGLFLLIFLIILKKLYTILSYLKKRPEHDVLWRQGKCLFAVIIGMMLTIFTTSSIGVIPHYYWSLLAVTVAYMNIVHRELSIIFSERNE